MKKFFIVDLAARVLERFVEPIKQMMWQGRIAADVIDRLRIPVYNMCKDQLTNEDPNTNMKVCEKAVYRAFILCTRMAELKGFTTRECTAYPAGSIDLTQYPFVPSISRRDIDIPQAVMDVWQHQSNQVYAMNNYSAEFFDTLIGSSLMETEKYDLLLSRFMPMFYEPATKLGEYSIPTNFGCWRWRGMQDTNGGMGGFQGGDVAKGTCWSATALPIEGEAVKPWLFCLKKGYGVTPKNWEEILADPDPHKTHGHKAVMGALAMKEWKETGKSSFLIGLDMITSLLMMTAILTGNRSLAKKVGLFTPGRPWDDGWKGTDPWNPVQHALCSMDPALFGWDPNDPRIRKYTKGGGTAWGFSAQSATIAWQLLSLDKDRDLARLDDSDGWGMEEQRERVSWPEVLHRVKYDEDSIEDQLRQAKKHARHLVKALTRQLPEMAAFNAQRLTLMRHRWADGSGQARGNGPLCDLPSWTLPDGAEITVEPWSRSKYKTHPLTVKVDGVTHSTTVSNLDYNPEPNLSTAEVHGWEAWAMREFIRRFSMAMANLGLTVSDVFDAVYIPGCFIGLAMKLWTEILIEMAHHLDQFGSPAQQLAEAMGSHFPKRQFKAEDINPMCSVMNA